MGRGSVDPLHRLEYRPFDTHMLPNSHRLVVDLTAILLRILEKKLNREGGFDLAPIRQLEKETHEVTHDLFCTPLVH